jgi:hypothetical protein
MEHGNHNIPSDIAKLIVGFFHYTLTPEEHNKLDEWVGLSDEHIQIFEDCVVMAQRPVQLQTDPVMDEDEG